MYITKSLTKNKEHANKERANIEVAEKGSVLFEKKIVLKGNKS